MKPKQLANALVKFLGLAVCLHAIPLFVSGSLFGFLGFVTGGADAEEVVHLLESPVGGVVEIAVGIVFIVKSRKIVELLYRGEADE